MPSDLFADLDRALANDGPDAAVDRLIASLRESRDYPALFYALLLRSRRALGVSPIPSRPASEIPDEKLDAYERAIRDAGREVGSRFLAAGDIPAAWNYFRLIGDTTPVREAIDTFVPGEDSEKVYPVIEIAFHHGVHPVKGLDLVLDRQGICSAITLLGNMADSLSESAKVACVGRLVRSLHAQLLERLRADVEGQEGSAPATLRELLAGRNWLFGEHTYHVDISHLSAVVQMSLNLAPGDELTMARELCAYGERLAPGMQPTNDEPFAQFYRDCGIYLRTVAGEEVDAGLGHFRAKALQADESFPAEVYVNLLLKVGREAEALAAAREFLAEHDERGLSCPGVLELSRRHGDFAGFAAAAKQRGDAVHYLAGLLSRSSELES
ncbi:MAG: hypothetical protein U0746_05425 [Gemmataceae bacterium]